jgi:hypothetical protein
VERLTVETNIFVSGIRPIFIHYFRHQIVLPLARTFVWAFVRSGSYGDENLQSAAGGGSLVQDEASIYSIHVTNVHKSGGGRQCRKCPVQAAVHTMSNTQQEWVESV